MSRAATKSPDPWRIGDEERGQCVDALSEHHAHGRLSQPEFNERLDAALAARTAGDLELLLADLPPHQEPRRSPARARWLRVVAAVGLVGVFAWLAAVWTALPERGLPVAVLTGLVGLAAGRFLVKDSRETRTNRR